jgi:hypothetical protein
MTTKADRLAKIAEIAQKVQIAGTAYEKLAAKNQNQLQRPKAPPPFKTMDFVTAQQTAIELNKPYGI